MTEPYNNINRQKETSDRLNSMRFNYFNVEGESPATTIDRITAYIEKMFVLARPVDRTEEAKARFLSNVTRWQIWAYHAKSRIAPNASYDPVIQAFATIIRDRTEFESGRINKGSFSSTETSYTRKVVNWVKKALGMMMEY